MKKSYSSLFLADPVYIENSKFLLGLKGFLSDIVQLSYEGRVGVFVSLSRTHFDFVQMISSCTGFCKISNAAEKHVALEILAKS